MSNYGKDESVLRQLQMGNRKAWEEFFHEHREAFKGFVKNYGRVDEELAESMYQEAVVLLHRNIRSARLQPPLRSSLRTYLFGIAKNLCRQQHRNPLNFPPKLPELPDYWFEQKVEQQHNTALVRSLLERLGGMCSEFLRLVFIEEKTQEEVCRLMQIPSPEAFRKRKHDCLKRIRKLLPDT